MVKLGSLFDGIGGFPYSATKYGITPVWASEIEPWPIKVTEYHYPDMVHLGDIAQISGAEIEPVDIITFGSPCQDLSVAGKRAGLEGERSGLFGEAVRIIREMRESTNGVYPRFAVWENVPGAFSSNKGQDFRAVLEEITETEIPMPESGKWAEAGMVRIGNCDIAWRTLDAQHWGVPQRRRRIFLIADFGGQCAGEILFESSCLRGDSAESGEAREETAGDVRNSTEESSRINCTRGGITGAVSSKWAKGTGGPAGDECYNLVVEPQLYDMTHADEVMRPVQEGLAPTLNSRMGTGGNQVPVMLEPIPIHDKATRYKGGGDTRNNDGAANGFGIGQEGDPMPTLGTSDRHAVGYPDPANTLLNKANLSFRDDQDTLITAVDCRNLCEKQELSGTLQSKANGGYSLNYQNPVRVGYAVRRLTPLECLRLQGYPDYWLDIEGMSDTAKYRAIGNSIAVPCVDFIMESISEVLKDG